MKRPSNPDRCLGLSLALLLGSAMAIAQPSQTVPKLKIVASTSDLAALVREIGGDRVVVESILHGHQDPHFAQPKPSYLLKLRQADLLIVVGSAT